MTTRHPASRRLGKGTLSKSVVNAREVASVTKAVSERGFKNAIVKHIFKGAVLDVDLTTKKGSLITLSTLRDMTKIVKSVSGREPSTLIVHGDTTIE